MEKFDEDTPLFVISIAAELANMHPQTLRQYDRLGLVSPSRTAGRTRRYTMRNIAELREIARLSGEGVSLEGIRRVLELVQQNHELTARVRNLERELADQVMRQPGNRIFAAGGSGVVPLPRGKRPDAGGAVVLWRKR